MNVDTEHVDEREEVVDFAVIKEKIIKTDKVLRMYSDLKKKNEFLETKLKEACKKFKQSANDLTVLKLEKDCNLHQFEELKIQMEKYRIENEKLTLELESSRSDFHHIVNEQHAFQLKHEDVCTELAKCQASLKKYDELSLKDETNKKPKKKKPKRRNSKGMIKVESGGEIEHCFDSTVEEECPIFMVNEDSQSILFKIDQPKFTNMALDQDVNSALSTHTETENLNNFISSLQKELQKVCAEKSSLNEKWERKVREMESGWSQLKHKLLSEIAELKMKVRRYEEKQRGKEVDENIDTETKKCKNNLETTIFKSLPMIQLDETGDNIEETSESAIVNLRESNLNKDNAEECMEAQVDDLPIIDSEEFAISNDIKSSPEHVQKCEKNTETEIRSELTDSKILKTNNDSIEKPTNLVFDREKNSSDSESISDERIIEILGEMRMIELLPPLSEDETSVISSHGNNAENLTEHVLNENKNYLDIPKTILNEPAQILEDKYLKQRIIKTKRLNKILTIKRAKEKIWLQKSKNILKSNTKVDKSKTIDRKAGNNIPTQDLVGAFIELLNGNFKKPGSRKSRNVLEINRMLREQAKLQNLMSDDTSVNSLSLLGSEEDSCYESLMSNPPSIEMQIPTKEYIKEKTLQIDDPILSKTENDPCNDGMEEDPLKSETGQSFLEDFNNSRMDLENDDQTTSPTEHRLSIENVQYFENQMNEKEIKSKTEVCGIMSDSPENDELFEHSVERCDALKYNQEQMDFKSHQFPFENQSNLCCVENETYQQNIEANIEKREDIIDSCSKVESLEERSIDCFETMKCSSQNEDLGGSSDRLFEDKSDFMDDQQRRNIQAGDSENITKSHCEDISYDIEKFEEDFPEIEGKCESTNDNQESTDSCKATEELQEPYFGIFGDIDGQDDLSSIEDDEMSDNYDFASSQELIIEENSLEFRHSKSYDRVDESSAQEFCVSRNSSNSNENLQLERDLELSSGRRDSDKNYEKDHFVNDVEINTDITDKNQKADAKKTDQHVIDNLLAIINQPNKLCGNEKHCERELSNDLMNIEKFDQEILSEFEDSDVEEPHSPDSHELTNSINSNLISPSNPLVTYQRKTRNSKRLSNHEDDHFDTEKSNFESNHSTQIENLDDFERKDSYEVLEDLAEKKNKRCLRQRKPPKGALMMKSIQIYKQKSAASNNLIEQPPKKNVTKKVVHKKHEISNRLGDSEEQPSGFETKNPNCNVNCRKETETTPTIRKSSRISRIKMAKSSTTLDPSICDKSISNSEEGTKNCGSCNSFERLEMRDDQLVQNLTENTNSQKNKRKLLVIKSMGNKRKKEMCSNSEIFGRKLVKNCSSKEQCQQSEDTSAIPFCSSKNNNSGTAEISSKKLQNNTFPNQRTQSKGKRVNIVQDIILQPAIHGINITELSLKPSQPMRVGGFKRPNNTKIIPCTPLSPPLPPIGEDVLPTEPRIIPLDKPPKLEQSKATVLFSKLITFSTEDKTVEEVARHFTSQEVDYIAKLIIEHIVQDTEKADRKYATGTLMTDTQRVMLGFMLKLEQMNVENLISECLDQSELRLFRAKTIQEVNTITRLYVAICKSHRYIQRVRRTLCDAFYFMGDLAIPFLYIVLVSWIETFPLEENSAKFSMVNLLVQLVNLKTCSAPEYNLLPLRELLNKYYKYPREAWANDKFFSDLLATYFKNPVKPADYPILLYCKNNSTKWVFNKIDTLLKPTLPKIKGENYKATVIILISDIVLQFNRRTDCDYIDKIRDWFKSILKEENLPNVVRTYLILGLRRFPKTLKKTQVKNLTEETKLN